MKSVFLLALCGVLILGCDVGKDKYDPDGHFKGLEKQEQLWKIIRYVAKAPDGLLFEERFYPGYDSFYRHQLTRHRFEAYFIDKNDVHYFLISRPAASLVEKRVATGGKMKFDKNGKLTEYEEVFRTWKMVPDTLAKRSLLLFDKMVKGESLDSFLTKNSNEVDFIEFPDDLNYFDKDSRRWLIKNTNPN